MDELLKNLASPSWWIGVVLLSVALNLVSAYLKAPLDRALARLSQRKRAKFVEEQKEIGAILEKALKLKDGIVLLAIEELKLFILGFLLIILCLTFLTFIGKLGTSLLIQIAMLLLTLGFVLLIFVCIRRATKLAEARKWYEERKPDA